MSDPALEERAGWFLDNACATIVNGPNARHRRMNNAGRLLSLYPEIARHNIYTAVICGDLDEVRRIIARDPGAATRKRAVHVSERATSVRDWEPLLYLCYARLPDHRGTEHSVDIARLLLDNGADANAHFGFGTNDACIYTALCGVVGEGEEDAPPHRHRNALARLLLERGAEPYDGQLIYNTHFHADLLWLLELMHEFSVKAGRAADWKDPQWTKIHTSGYGNGARWFLGAAVRKNNLPLARWILSHGASPEPEQPRNPKQQSKLSMYQLALSLGFTEMAGLLAHHGARVVLLPRAEGVHAFIEACLSGDASKAKSLAARDPDFLKSPRPLAEAIGWRNLPAVRLLLDLGVPPNSRDPANGGQTPMHVAAYKNAVDIAKLLVERGADTEVAEKNFGATPLGFAVYGRHAEMIEFLAAYSRDIWELAIIGANTRLRELLDKEPALAKTANDYGTPLFWLADDESRALETAELFLARGADANARNADGKTAADIADFRGMARVAARLRRATA